MALIWIYGKKSSNRTETPTSRLLQRVFSRYGLLLFLAIIFLLAFVEEGLWDIQNLVLQLNTLLLHPKYPGIAHSWQHKANYYKKLRTNKVSAFLDF